MYILVLSTHFCTCLIGHASKIAHPKIRVPRKKFVYPCVCKTDVLEDFEKFAGTCLYQILYSIKLQDPGSNDFLWILWNIYEHLF